MSERLARFDNLAIGLTPDLPDQTPDLWEDGRNVLFVDKELQPLPGQIALTNTGLQVNAVCQINDLVFLGTSTSVLVYSISRNELHNVTSADDHGSGQWSFVPYGNWMIGSHGGFVYIWKPGNDETNPPQFYKITDAPTGIDFLLKLKNFVLAVGNQYVYWCNDDNPEEWTPEQDNLAGYLFIRDIRSDLEGGAANEDIALIGTQKEVIKLTYIGTPYVFGYKKVFEGAGIWNLKSITVVNNTFFGFGPNGAWASNGSSFSYIDKGAVSDTIQKEFELTKSSLAYVGPWNILQHVFFFVPTFESVKCYAFNLLNSKWTILTWDRVCSYKEYWVDSKGILYLDDLKSASSLAGGDGNLTISENATGLVGYGCSKIECQGFGGVLWFLA